MRGMSRGAKDNCGKTEEVGSEAGRPKRQPEAKRECADKARAAEETLGGWWMVDGGWCWVVRALTGLGRHRGQAQSCCYGCGCAMAVSEREGEPQLQRLEGSGFVARDGDEGG